MLFDKATVGLPKENVITQIPKNTEEYIVDRVEPTAAPEDSSQEEPDEVAPPSQQVNVEIAESEESEENEPSLEDSQEEAVPEAAIPSVPSNNKPARSTMTMTTTEPRRSSQTQKPTERYVQYLVGNFAKVSEDISELQTVKEALKSEHADKWKEVMNAEYALLLKNRMWKLVLKPQDHKTIGCR